MPPPPAVGRRPLAQIGGDHPGVGADRRRPAVGDPSPWSSTTTRSEMRITTPMSCSISRMRAAAAADLQQQRAPAPRISRGFSPAAGSSRQSSDRVGAHGARDLQPPLRAVGQRAGRVVGAVEQLGALQPVPRLLHRRALRRRVARQAEHGADAEAGGGHQRVVLRDQQVLQHRHAGEQPDVLEGARDAGAGDAVAGQSLQFHRRRRRGVGRCSRMLPSLGR